jgi:hypothetical protein
MRFMTDKEIDWSTAEVHDGTLTVEVDGKGKKDWTRRFRAIVGRLDRAGQTWGEISIAKRTITVKAVEPGSEDDLRHLLEATVQQVNADFDESHAPTAADGIDQKMTEAFREFAPDRDAVSSHP